jgi:hypothetical protein
VYGKGARLSSGKTLQCTPTILGNKEPLFVRAAL